jgi:predicted Zn-dependent protease
MIAFLRRGCFTALFSLILLAHLNFAAMPAYAQQGPNFLRDAETERLMHDMMRPLAIAAGVNPSSVEMFLIGDPTPNAFVALGQNIFLHAGLILTADEVGEVMGVLAHEMGHISGGHLARVGEGFQDASTVSIISLLLGAAAIAAGAGDAGTAILLGGQTAAAGKFFAFSRIQESSADQAGAEFLEKAQLSGKGFLEFFEKLDQLRMRAGVFNQNVYAQTHPLTAQRIQSLEERLKASPYWDKPSDADLEYRFQRVRAKLSGFIFEPQQTFATYPESNTTEFARLARAYAWHKLAETDKARAEIQALLQARPDDPYYLELMGQIMMESGQVAESIPFMRRAIAAAPNEPLISAMLGHALLSLDDPVLAKEAIGILETSLRQDKQNPFAWYQLGIAYGKSGDETRAALAAAERYSLIGAPREALGNAKRALRGLKTGTAEWLRAQDIVVITEQALKRGRRS